MAANEQLVELVESLFSKESTPQRVREVEGSFDAQLWEKVASAGLTELGQTNSGATLYDLVAVVGAGAKYNACIPLGDTLVASTYLGADAPSGPLSLVPLTAKSSLARIHYPTPQTQAVVVYEGGVRLHKVSELAAVKTGTNYAGEPFIDVDAGTLRTTGTLVDNTNFTPIQALASGAFARTMSIVGSLEQVVDLSIRYCNEREQFGKPIGKFQILQHYLAEMAGEASACRASLENAVDVIVSGASMDQQIVAIAMAKTYAGRAVATVNRLAHQIHGAIGFTDEHDLQLSTRRLWSWHDEFGSDAYWSQVVGEAFCAKSQGDLWASLSQIPPVIN